MEAAWLKRTFHRVAVCAKALLALLGLAVVSQLLATVQSTIPFEDASLGVFSTLLALAFVIGSRTLASILILTTTLGLSLSLGRLELHIEAPRASTEKTDGSFRSSCKHDVADNHSREVVCVLRGVVDYGTEVSQEFFAVNNGRSNLISYTESRLSPNSISGTYRRRARFGIGVCAGRRNSVVSAGPAHDSLGRGGGTAETDAIRVASPDRIVFTGELRPRSRQVAFVVGTNAGVIREQMDIDSFCAQNRGGPYLVAVVSHGLAARHELLDVTGAARSRDQ